MCEGRQDVDHLVGDDEWLAAQRDVVHARLEIGICQLDMPRGIVPRDQVADVYLPFLQDRRNDRRRLPRRARGFFRGGDGFLRADECLVRSPQSPED